MVVNFIKVCGNQRTGTNYTARLLEENFKVQDIRHLKHWKHNPPVPYIPHEDWTMTQAEIDIVEDLNESISPEIQKAWNNREVKYIICIKNPYSWYNSFASYQNFKPDNYRPKAIKRWNEKYKRWIKFHEYDEFESLFVRYIDLLNFPTELRNIEKNLDLEKNSKFWTDINGRMDTEGRETDEEFDDSFYTEHRYLDELSGGIINLISHDVDKSLMNYFDYEVRG